MKLIKNISKLLILGLALLLVFVIRFAKVNGSSMEPNLMNNTFIMYSKLVNTYNRFDIIVVEINDKLYIKRIIGMPGEKVNYKSNTLFINDKQVSENYARSITYDFKLSEISSYNAIPNSQYLILGDNRFYSYDSRDFGLIDKSNIKGKLIFNIN